MNIQVICKHNTIQILHPELQRFAFRQDQDGIVPLTVGIEYEIFGVKENALGKFYLTLTDDEDLPWWMPAPFFHETNDQLPEKWKREEYKNVYGHNEVVVADADYFGHEDDIEDGTAAGYSAFYKMQNNGNE